MGRWQWLWLCGGGRKVVKIIKRSRGGGTNSASAYGGALHNNFPFEAHFSAPLLIIIAQSLTTKISEVKTKTARGQPMYFEDCRGSCKRRLPKTTRNLPKISEHFRRSPITFENFRRLLTISDDFGRSLDIFEAFPSLGRSRAMPSPYVS